VKKRIVVVGLLMFSVGCAVVPYDIRKGTLGQSINATIGSPLVTVERGVKNDLGLIVERYSKDFIYSGKAGSIVRFSYREFAGRQGPNGGDADLLARPAFTQEVQYDLAESDEIAFQDMRLKVLKATNTQISVFVLSELMPFTPPPPRPPMPEPTTEPTSSW
jgi:hypothetical protein